MDQNDDRATNCADMSNRMRLNANEEKVLAYLASEEEGFWCFAAIGECVRLDRKVIRRACRSLARKGLTEFGRGLWDDEGPRGSGYRITKTGRGALPAAQ